MVGQLDRKALEAAAKAKDVAVAPDGTLEAFTAALEGAEGLEMLQPTSMCALAWGACARLVACWLSFSEFCDDCAPCYASKLLRVDTLYTAHLACSCLKPTYILT